MRFASNKDTKNPPKTANGPPRLSPSRGAAGLDPSGILALFLLIPLGHFDKPGIVDFAGHIVLIEPFKEHIQLPVPG